MIKTFSIGLVSLIAVVALSGAVQATPARPTSRTQVGADTSRTVELRYESGAIPYVACFNCPNLTPRRGERFMTVEVIDDVSPLAVLDVAWTTNNPDDPGYFVVCGETEEPQRIPPSADLTLYPWMVPGSPYLDDPGGGCTEAFSTSGTIKITFFRRLPR